MLCHGLDFDDTHSDSVAHVSDGRRARPRAALAEARGASGRELLTAIVAGERDRDPHRHGRARARFHGRGFHPTAICGIFGATAAAARLGGLAGRRRRRARSASPAAWPRASSPTSTTRPRRSRSTPPGPRTARCVAARLAALGAEGPPGVLEGRFGVYHAFVDTRIDLEPQLADLGERWETPRIAFKPYPACHFIHGSLGATASLGRRGSTRTRSRRSSSRCPEAGVVARARAGGGEGRAAHRLRGQVQPPVLDRGDARPRPRRPGHVHAGGARRPARARARPRRCATRRRSTRRYPAAFPGGVRIMLRDGRDARGRPPAPARRAREPDDAPSRCARSSARTPRSRGGGVRGARGGDPRPRASATTSRGLARGSQQRRRVTATPSSARSSPRSASGSSARSTRSPPTTSTPTSTRSRSSRT